MYWTVSFVIPGVDALTDIISGIRFLYNGDVAFGTLTLAFPFAPAIVAFFLKIRNKTGRWQTLVNHLPLMQLKNHAHKLGSISNLLSEVAVYEEELEKLKQDDQTPQNDQQIKDKEGEKAVRSKEIDDCKTELQKFKIYSGMLESAPQAVLQLSVLLKEFYHAAAYHVDALVMIQIISSMSSVLLTVTGLICEMPFIVHKTERTPIRNLSFTFLKILPLVMCSVLPRLLSMIVICSFVTFQDWLFYTIFGASYFGAFFLSCVGISHFIKNRYPRSDSSMIKLGLITSIVSPCVIGIFGSPFLVVSSLSTTFLQSLALAALCAVGNMKPSLVLNSGLTVMEQMPTTIDIYSEDDLENEQISYLNHFTWILIPILLLTNLLSFYIQKFVIKENNIYKLISAIESGNQHVFEQEIAKKKFDLNAFVPGDEENRSLFWYTHTETDQITTLIKKFEDFKIDLRMENREGKTPLMVSCEKSYPNSVEALIQHGGDAIGINYIFNKNKLYQSALHFAASASNGSLEDKKKVFELLWSHAKTLKADFLLKNYDGKTPMDILVEEAETAKWFKELSQTYGSPMGEMNSFKEKLEEENIDLCCKLVNNDSIFMRSFESLLLYAIEKDTSLAISMIKRYIHFDLKLGLAANDRFKNTPLIFACSLKKTEIVQALLETDPKEIDINYANNQGQTACLHAFENGLTDIAQIFLEKSSYLGIDLTVTDSEQQTLLHLGCRNGDVKLVSMLMNIKDSKIDLNAKNLLNQTAFLVSCTNRQSQVVDWMFAQSETHEIDLSCKDNNNLTGFDFWIPTQEAKVLKDAIISNDEEQWKKVFGKKFISTKEVFLLYAIEKDEELALLLIDKSQQLGLNLDKNMTKMEYNTTPLADACELERPEILKALISKNVNINFRMENGETAFYRACKKGSVKAVSLMLEMSFKYKIDLNAIEDKQENTGFIIACKMKHFDVIEVLESNAEKFNINLKCRDWQNKTGHECF